MMNINDIPKVIEMQEKGIEVEVIASKFGYKNEEGLKRYMRSKGYSCIEGVFIKRGESSNDEDIVDMESESVEDVVEDKNEGKSNVMSKDQSKEVVESVKKKSKSVSNNELNAKLDEIKNEMERIKFYMVEEHYKNRFELPVKTCDKSNPTSVRLYKDDKEAFDNLCKSKFRDINKDALFSMAIREFVEKYGD